MITETLLMNRIGNHERITENARHACHAHKHVAKH